MKQLTIEELKDRWVDVEQAVDATDGIDPWCSALDWVLPVAMGFAPRGKRLLLESDNGAGYALLGYYRRDDSIFLAGIEPLWGFASPIFGPNMQALAAELVEELMAKDDWTMMALPGLPPQPHGLTDTLVDAFSTIGHCGIGEGITRRVADLSDGYDHWLANRSSRFRRNLRQAAAKAEDQGLEILEAGNDPTLFDRILAIDTSSWKGKDGSGITSTEMSTMYQTMIERLSRRDRLQAFVATLPQVGDVGYILGGIRSRRYRGLQISFADGFADLSIGNLLQEHQIRHLANNGLAGTYDMGMDFPYKQRWADEGQESVTLLVYRS